MRPSSIAEGGLFYVYMRLQFSIDDFQNYGFNALNKSDDDIVHVILLHRDPPFHRLAD